MKLKFVDISSYLSLTLNNTGLVSNLVSGHQVIWGKLCVHPQTLSDHKTGKPRGLLSFLSVCANADGFLTSREEWGAGTGSEQFPSVAALKELTAETGGKKEPPRCAVDGSAPMQGTLVQPLAWEDSACFETTRPLRHNCSPHSEPRSRTAESADESLCSARLHSRNRPQQVVPARTQPRKPSCLGKRPSAD